MDLPSIFPFFAPKGVAVIGASQDPTKLGYGLARNLVQSYYPGAVHFINPRGGSLLGHPIYVSVAQVPDPVDLAILLIPAAAVPQALQECRQRGILAAIIGSGGFRETGAEGAALEAECLRIAREAGMRLLGPNSVGILDTHLPMNATFLSPPGPTPGDVAFISHSGAICAAVSDWARGQGFGLSRLLSLGNQVDVNETDVLEPTASDAFTRVLTCYLEGVSNGRRFLEVAGRVTPRKPIIALKVGRFTSGQRAVASHTGALAGQENAFNAAFRRAGVIRAETSEEMFDWARVLAWCPLPRGRNVAVLTNAGGPGVTAADALEAHGLCLADLQEETKRGLAQLLPPAASLHNPIDMLASASPEQYAGSLKILLADPGVDSILVILPPPPMFSTGAVAKGIIPVIHAGEKPVIVALMGERLIQEAVEHFREARVPEYRFPERAASALAILVQRAGFLNRLAELEKEKREEIPAAESGARSIAAVSSIIEKAPPGHFLAPDQVRQVFQAYHIPVLPEQVARSAEEAGAFSTGMGFPVALKVVSPDILHKTDVGGVQLNILDEAGVCKAFTQVIENARTAAPRAHIDGVLVQKMVSAGQEVIIGSVLDDQFGPLIMFGSGGVEVEGIKDLAYALAPLDREECAYLLENTWAGRKLKGFRNLAPADREALIEVLLRFSRLAVDFPEISEMEMNPLLVLPEGQGVYPVDARIRVCMPSSKAG